MSTCTVEDCDRKRHSKNLCNMHHKRLWRHGDPQVVKKPPVFHGEDHPSWKGAEVSYLGLHVRIVSFRGPAKRLECVDCDKQAAHWSYDHTGIDERVENGTRFSTDIEQYSPRCVSCHKKLDLAVAV